MASRSKTPLKRSSGAGLTPEEAQAIHRYLNEETTFFPSKLDTNWDFQRNQMMPLGLKPRYAKEDLNPWTQESAANGYGAA